MTVAGTPYVWVQAFANGVPNWCSGAWAVQDRLLPEDTERHEGSTGAGSFTLLRRVRNDGKGTTADTWVPQRGQYIAITTDGDDFSADDILWCGQITGFEPTPIAFEDDEIGTVSAQELGSVFDDIPVAHLRQLDQFGVADSELLTNPTANYPGRHEGEVIGNCVTGQAGIPVFQSDPAQCGTADANYWTRYKLLQHLVAFVPKGTILPPLDLAFGTGVDTYLNLVTKEIYSFDGARLSDELNVIVGPQRGVTWRIIPNAQSWTIHVDSAIDVIAGDIPAQTAVDAQLKGDDIDLTLNEDGDDTYQAVEIIGNPIVFCGTVSPIDGTMDQGWTAGQETLYQNGLLGGSINGQSYASMSLAQQEEANAAIRGSAAFEDVYRRYIVKAINGNLLCRASTGAPSPSTIAAMCVLVNWDGTTATLATSGDTSPYIPTVRLLRNIPWPLGQTTDPALDQRNASQKAQPTYAKPMIFRYTEAGSAASGDEPNPSYQGWLDLVHPPSLEWPVPEADIDDTGAGLRISMGAPELLARGHWSGAEPSAHDPSLTGTIGATNWESLVCTIAVEGDQRVKVRKLKPGYTEAQVRNTLRIYRKDLHCWVMRKHTIVGLDKNKNPDEVTADTFIRNDFLAAQKLCDEAAAFAFRKRTAAIITLVDPTSPPAWAEIGTLIGNVVEFDKVNGVWQQQISRPLGTVVRSLRQVWSAQAPRLIVATDYPPTPSSTDLVPGRTLGGEVSISLGGTQSAAVQRLQSEMVTVIRDNKRVPVIVGRPGVPDAPSAEITVTKTAHGLTVGQVATITGYPAQMWNWSVSPRQAFDLSTIHGDNLGFVVRVVSADVVVLCVSGFADIPTHGYTPIGGTLYLSNTPGIPFPSSSGTGALDAGFQVRPVAYILDSDTLVVFEPDYFGTHPKCLYELTDVNFAGSRGAAYPADGNVLTYVSARSEWQAKSLSISSLANIAGISVLGRAANSTGPVAALSASTTGDVLSMGATSLTWGQLQTASYANGSVTIAKLANYSLATLSDVSLTSTADLDFLRYDAASSKWKNVNLGKLGYQASGAGSSANSNLLYFGSVSAGTNTNLGIINGSRILLDGDATAAGTIEWLYAGAPVSSTDKWAVIKVSSSSVSFQDNGTEVLKWLCNASTATSRLFDFKVRTLMDTTQPFDFLLSGDPTIGTTTDKCARMLAVSATQVSWFDQASTSGGNGTEVFRWATSSSAGSRSFDFKIATTFEGLVTLSGSANLDLGSLIIYANKTAATTAYLSSLSGSGAAWDMGGTLTLHGAFAAGGATLGGAGTISAVSYIANGNVGANALAIGVAKLTPGGTNGSITITGGIVTAFTAPT